MNLGNVTSLFYSYEQDWGSPHARGRIYATEQHIPPAILRPITYILTPPKKKKNAWYWRSCFVRSHYDVLFCGSQCLL